MRETAVWMQLDDAQFSRKLDAVRAYSSKLAAEVDVLMKGQLYAGLNRFSEPALAVAAAGEAGIGLETLAEFPELYEQIQGVVAGISMDDFRTEYLRPVTPFECLDRTPGKPFYEFYGECLVAAGYYREVIRYREHVRPILEGLRAWRHRRAHGPGR